MNIDQALGYVIRCLRTERGKEFYSERSQRSLAEKSGVPAGAVSKIENGKVPIRLSDVAKISAALEVPLWKIIKMAEELIS